MANFTENQMEDFMLRGTTHIPISDHANVPELKQ